MWNSRLRKEFLLDFGKLLVSSIMAIMGIWEECAFSLKDGILRGFRHILPADISETSLGQTEDFWETSVRSGNHNGVIVYYHGVTGTRGKPHRLELYKVLQNHGHHIITCDYRGFADSTKVKRITESGIVTDAINVYRWVKNDLLKGHAEIPIFVWGHSLGTGYAASGYCIWIMTTLKLLVLHSFLLQHFHSFGTKVTRRSKHGPWWVSLGIPVR